MKAAIDSAHGRALYGRRIATVEPVFANLRHNKRLDRVTLRSRPKVNAQWHLYCLATWRASADWGEKLGYTAKQMADANRKAVALLEEVRSGFGADAGKAVISGCVGPRGDGYNPGKTMSEDEAEDYHCKQIEVFEDFAADNVTAITTLR